MENKPIQPFVISDASLQRMFTRDARKRPLDDFKWVGEWEGEHVWAKSINNIIDMMSAFNEKYPEHQFVIRQIKEKFGSLRFYYDSPGEVPIGALDEFYDIVDHVSHAVKNSTFMCTTPGCGSIDGEQVTTKSGWINVLCKSCAEKELDE